jgi:hypothetical protein
MLKRVLLRRYRKDRPLTALPQKLDQPSSLILERWARECNRLP